MCCKPQCLFVTYCIAETMFSNAWKPRSQYSKTISKWLTGGQPPSNESSYTSCPTKEPLHLSPQHQITHVSHFPSVEDPCRLRPCITYYISIWAPKWLDRVLNKGLLFFSYWAVVLILNIPKPYNFAGPAECNKKVQAAATTMFKTPKTSVSNEPPAAMETFETRNGQEEP